MILENDYTPAAGKDVAAQSLFGSSGTLVGRNWALCSRHQDTGFEEEVTFRDVVYPIVAEAEPGLIDTAPVSDPGVAFDEGDLKLVRVDEEFPTWARIDPSHIAYGTPVVLAGRGLFRDTIPGTLVGASYDGLHYGTNVIEDPGDRPAMILNGDQDYLYLALSLDTLGDGPVPGALDTEALPAANDSGGGVFTIGSGGDLRLCGIIFTGVGVGGEFDYSQNYVPIVNDKRFWSESHRLERYLPFVFDTTMPGARTCRSLVYQSRADRSWAGASNWFGDPVVPAPDTGAGAPSQTQLLGPRSFRITRLRLR